MYNIIHIRQSNISQKVLDEIIKIKSVAWPFSYKDHNKWIHNNLIDSDIHLILSLNGTNVAYLNLINLKLELDGNIHTGFGLGNICVIEKGKGWGTEILTQANIYIKKEDNIGLLFCKNSRISFFSSNNWVLLDKNKLTLPFNNILIETMIFNCNTEFRNLNYRDRIF